MVRQAMLLNKYSVALTVKSESPVWLDRSLAYLGGSSIHFNRCITMLVILDSNFRSRFCLPFLIQQLHLLYATYEDVSYFAKIVCIILFSNVAISSASTFRV